MVKQRKKESVLAILKILEDYTDRHHYLTQQQIAEKVGQKHGIFLERKAIASGIRVIEDYGYDISRAKGGGVALIDRGFDETQIKYLVDSIYSSRSISPSQAKELVKHLTSYLSTYERDMFQNVYKSYDITRSGNDDLFSSIDMISEGMKTGYRISFTYMTYGMDGSLTPFREKRYIVNPFYLVNNFGRYYLICTHFNYDEIRVYRVDFMRDVMVETHLAKKKEDLTCFDNFDIDEYLNTHVYMYGGKPIKAKLELLRGETSIRNLYDWFGRKARCFREEDHLYAEVETASKNLIYWALQYGEDVVILEPTELREEMVDFLRNMRRNYRNTKGLGEED